MPVTRPVAICESSPTFVCVMRQREKTIDESASFEEEEEEGREKGRFNICKYMVWLGPTRTFLGRPSFIFFKKNIYCFFFFSDVLVVSHITEKGREKGRFNICKHMVWLGSGLEGGAMMISTKRVTLTLAACIRLLTFCSSPSPSACNTPEFLSPTP